VDNVRDLGEIDLWEESLQRSLARRALRPKPPARRPLMHLVGLGGASTAVLLAAMLPGLLGGKSASAHAERLAYIDHGPGSASESGPLAGPEVRRLPPRLPTQHRAGYVNPLAHASVTPERIDQGVDYGGTGPLSAIGTGRITYVGTSNTGWPGAFIEFRLSAGPDAGRYVFYAEGIEPAHGLHVGQRVRAGQTVATLTGSSGGIEIGWGAGVGTETYAMKVGQWQPGMDDGNTPTAAGRSFSALIASLGGPPGKIEG
jgi:murein DD-endopeptidase MepM/ murein hydrolase activator NlpD